MEIRDDRLADQKAGGADDSIRAAKPGPAAEEVPAVLSPTTLRSVAATWIPLGASWLLMGAELPILSAVIARMANPEVNLAAFGGIVFPLALIIESPIVMLLAASTALSRDWDSYRMLRRFVLQSAVTLTLIHAVIVFTPLYFYITRDLMNAPEEIIHPARIGLMIMLPWSSLIAYRRFQQGVLIRFGYAKSVGIGTAFRLLVLVATLSAGYQGEWIGSAVAAAALVAGILTEFIYVWFRIQPILRSRVRPAANAPRLLTRGELLSFYAPLALTSFCSLGVQPMITGSISRMPDPMSSLAIWPAMAGLLFLLRSGGLAYNEVVVSLADMPGGYTALKRFAFLLSALLTSLLIVAAMTPLAYNWFLRVAGLRMELAQLAGSAFWLAILLPALGVYQSLFQGILVNRRKTRAVTESVLLFISVTFLVLVIGSYTARVSGIFVGLIALTVGHLAQLGWMFHRSADCRREISQIT